MAVRIETMAEPLPGYRLIERLGGGGFGEVWKAEAPGGLFKAIKFVYGDLESAGEEAARAGQEFKALKRVVTVRHPFILSLERFDIVDGQLMIVTELADRTLWDRFRECRTQGLSGIPRDELLSYLEDTAEALDLMHTQYQLQHLDIKPQNLFLVHNHVKVADFGLVKDLEGVLASVTGGVTPVYAAPETFEGKVSRSSDQYSLAIVYQELLTGQRPYSGQTLRQLVLQHCQGTPDLKPLPDHDRPVVLRALAKKHEERFASCADFLKTLREVGKAPRPAESLPPPLPKPSPADDKPRGQPTDEGSKTQGPPPPRSVMPVPLSAPTAMPPSEAWPQPVVRRQERAAEQSLAALSGKESTAETPQELNGAATPPGPGKAAINQTEGVLVPALVIGLGQFGMGTLRQLRHEMSDNFGPANLPALRLLYIDADPETSQRATRGADYCALRASEVLLARLHRPSHYIKPRELTTGLETWLNPKMLYRMPRQQTPSGIRALGRLAYVDNAKVIARRLFQELKDCCSQDALERTSAETGLVLRGTVPRVYLVTNLAGGTGSGMYIDLAYLLQQQLHLLGHDSAEVVGICYLPPADAEARRTAELANAFAALTELNYFSAPQTTFTARYELGEVRSGTPVFVWKGPPLKRCQFFALPDTSGGAISEDSSGAPVFAPPLAGALARAARCLFGELMTPLGRVAEEQRKAAAASVPLTASRTRGHVIASETALFQLVGLDRCIWPRRQLLERAAALVCKRVVQRWMSKDAKPLKEAVQQWVQQQWEHHHLSAEQVITRYQEIGANALSESPDALFQKLHQSVLKGLHPQPGKHGDGPINLAVVVEAMEQYEQLVGVPEEFQPVPGRGEPSSYHPGSLEIALHDAGASIIEQYEQRMNVLAVRLIEDPNFRLAGAEEALRQLHAQVEQALLAQEQLAGEYKARATLIYKRIQQVTNVSANASQSTTLTFKASRRPAAGPPPTAAELPELLRAYPKLRYNALIMHRVTALYTSLRGQLSDQLREVDFCRARLGELQSVFAAVGATNLSVGPAAGRYLFNDGCQSLEDAVRRIDASVSASDLMDVDTRMQGLIRKQFKALVHVCMSTANVLRTLAPAMQKEARAFLRGRMGDIHIAEVFLQQYGELEDAAERLEDELAECFERAAPEVVASPPAHELNVLAVPPGQGEEQVRQRARQGIPEKTLVAVGSKDEITIYREHTLGCLADLKQLGPAGQAAYHKVVACEHFTPHCRADIMSWGTRRAKKE
jgi:serine/threonine protein kinase